MPDQHRLEGGAGVQNAADKILYVNKVCEGEEDKPDEPSPRIIKVIGKRYCADSKVPVMLLGHLDQYRDPTSEELADMRRKYKQGRAPRKEGTF
jgi:hypothetical protein